MSPNKSLLFCLGLAALTVMGVWASYATIAKSSGEEPDWAGILFGILFFGLGSIIIGLFTIGWFYITYFKWLKWRSEQLQEEAKK